MEVDMSTRSLETAEALRSRLENSQLRISEARLNYQSMLENGGESGVLERSGPPSAVEADTSAQMEYLRKLKFQYLEEYSKDKYVKIIVNDDPPEITTLDNERLQATNTPKKEKLKMKKVALAEKWTDVVRLAPLVEQDYRKAQSLTSEVVALAKDNVGARLALCRLRQTHPQPRYTVMSAEERLASQILEMQNVEERLQQGAQLVVEIKNAVKATVQEVDRLRMERAELEKQLKEQSRTDRNDEEVASLHEWFTGALSFHQALFGLESLHEVAENELRLTYRIDHTPQRKSHTVGIDLIFVPNSRQLASVQIEGLNGSDTEAFSSAYMHANDAPGLISAVVHRARRLARLL